MAINILLREGLFFNTVHLIDLQLIRVNHSAARFSFWLTFWLTIFTGSVTSFVAVKFHQYAAKTDLRTA